MKGHDGFDSEVESDQEQKTQDERDRVGIAELVELVLEVNKL